MTDVVTAFCRHRGELLLVRRGEAAGCYQGRWGGVSGNVESETDTPLTDARRELREAVGVDDAELVRAGDPLSVVDDSWGQRMIHPFLFDVDDRAVELNRELVDHEWTDPAAMFDRECVPRLWETYRRVGPTVEHVVADEISGSAAVSVTALEALRDAASEAANADDVESPAASDWPAVVDAARRLRDARPSMVVVANRVNRVLAAAGGAEADDPTAVAARAHEELGEALDADARAASEAAAVLETLASPPTVCTLSRSGTVRDALTAVDADVVLSESRTGNEGVDVAEELADSGHSVILTTDAALPSVVAGAVGPTPDAVLVGADAVLPDGTLVNKVGTRSLGLACAREGVPCYVVAARDKIAGAAVDWGEAGFAGVLYDGDSRLTVVDPVFDATPGDCVTGVVTEDGVLEPSDIAEVAATHRGNASWDA